jgi:hypothetical protein
MKKTMTKAVPASKMNKIKSPKSMMNKSMGKGMSSKKK